MTEVARLVGLRASGGPLFQTSVPLAPGLTVLYGLNGAGKTWLLDCLHAALTGRRVRLDGRALPTDADAGLFVESSEPRRFALRDSVGWLWLAGADLAPNPEDVAAFREQQESDRYWCVSPGWLVEPRWLTKLAAAPMPGSIARRVFDMDQTLKMAVRALIAGDSDLALAHLQEWPLGEQLESRLGQAVDGGDEALAEVVMWLIGVADVSAVFDPNPNYEYGDYPDDAPLNADDGLPVALANTGIPGPQFDSLALPTLVTEWVEGSQEDDLLEVLHEGGWLLTAEGWQEYPLDLTGLQERLDPEYPSTSLAGRLNQIMLSLAGAHLVLEPWAAQVSDVASRIASRFLLDSPRLRLDISTNVLDTFRGHVARWSTEDGRDLDSLSRAERRWARLAIRLALLATTSATEPDEEELSTDGEVLHLGSPTVIVIDEPEGALHRSAEEHMAAGLSWLARNPDVYLVVATHSPHLLDAHGASVHRVHRRNVDVVRGSHSVPMAVACTSALSEVSRRNMAHLGMQPSDLLRRTRAFLLVEGLHDELVLRQLIGRDLDALRVEILPLRGAKNLPAAVDSRFLFDYTDAVVIPVVDNMEAARLTRTWDQACVLAAGQGAKAGQALLLEELRGRAGSETVFMREFLTRAIEFGLQARVAPFALPAADVLHYLPVDAFVSRPGTTWAGLWEEHRSALESGTTQIRDAKKWVTKVHNTDFGDDRMTDASGLLVAVPDDIQALVTHCDLVVSRLLMQN